MRPGASGSFGARLKALREAAGYTQEELATISGLSVHAVSALERGERRRPHVETVRALSAALDLAGPTRDELLASSRAPALATAVDELTSVSLPLPPTPLLGRDVDVQTLRDWLADPAARLITLIGPGGVGKSRLALELARAIAEEGATRVEFVPLAAIRDPGLAACAVAEALGLADISATDLPKRARAACAGHPTLLVLDNCEQVPDATPLVADLLTSTPTLRLLITSRAPLRVRGEREYALGPLALEAGSEAMSPADLARVPAVRLFVERVRDVQPDFRLTPANSPTVTAICRRLDALPLALELAAPWMKVLTAEGLLSRLEQDVLLSAVGPRDLPERQQTMNATVAWSYQLLSPDEQRAFRRFGALPGRFSVDAAAAVLAGHEGASTARDKALSAVARLIDKSLLLRTESSVPTRPLYQMLETVRAYAALELTNAGERDDALEALVRYCTGEAILAVEGLVGLNQAEWLDRVHDDLQNYRDALKWLTERSRSAEASNIVWGLKFFWLIRGHAAEGLWWYEATLRMPSLPPAAESQALVGAALMWFTQGDLERARKALTRALALAQVAGDMEMIAHAEVVFGHVEQGVGEVTSTRDRFTRSVDAYRSLSIPWGTGSALAGLANVTLAAGDTVQAEHLLDEATTVLRSAGPYFLTSTLYVRAILALRRGSPDDALVLVRESLTRVREIQDRFAFVYALVPLAAAAVQKGDDAWAARIVGARDAVTERTGATVADKSVHDLREQSEREARARLGLDRWAQAYAAGRVASIDALLKDIDNALSRRAHVKPVDSATQLAGEPQQPDDVRTARRRSRQARLATRQIRSLCNPLVHAPRLGCREMPFGTHRTPQLLLGPLCSHQSVLRVVIGSEQQMADLVGDDSAQHAAWIRPGADRHACNSVGKHRRERTRAGLEVDDRFAERYTTARVVRASRPENAHDNFVWPDCHLAAITRALSRLADARALDPDRVDSCRAKNVGGGSLRRDDVVDGHARVVVDSHRQRSGRALVGRRRPHRAGKQSRHQRNSHRLHLAHRMAA